jgi:hypothetical protein
MNRDWDFAGAQPQQVMPRERWLEKRKDEILPVSYFHAVFILPNESNTVILNSA